MELEGKTVKLQIVSAHKKWRVYVTHLNSGEGKTTIGRIGAIPKGKSLIKSFHVTAGETIQFGKSQVLVLKYKGA